MNDWEAFFDGYASRYMDEPFVTATAAEVDFIEELFPLPAAARVLDLGCGTGRHTVALAARGYSVTGVDLSAGMLAEAAAAAAAAGVTVSLVKADAARFRTADRFDLAVCLCEGAFGLLGPGDEGALEQPLAILETLREALRPGCGFVLTVLNGLRPARAYGPRDVTEGRFDPMTLCERHPLSWVDDAGEHVAEVRERGFVPTELRLLCRLAGLSVMHVWGGTAGRWGRRPLDLDEYEIMVVGRREE